MSTSPALVATSDETAPRLAVCLCTYRRPVVLRDLLDVLNEEARLAIASVNIGTVAVVVVDDDPAASAEPVVTAAMHPCLTLHYLHSGLGNVAAARNRAVDEAVEQGDLIMMIDDDCRPAPGWMRELVSVLQRTNADAVVGACDTDFPPGAPRWLREQPFVDRPVEGNDAQPTDSGYIKNCLFTAEFINRHRLRFDLDYGKSGGEDAVFLATARGRGVHMVYAANATVYEELPPERATLRYQLRRRMWYGNTEVLTSLVTNSASKKRMLAASVKIALLGLVRPAWNIVRGKRPEVLFNLSEILRASGRALGVVGVKLDHR